MPTQQVLLSHADVTNDAAPFAESRSGKAPGGGEPAGGGLSALRLVPVPDTDPPFDGDPPTGAPAPAALWASGTGGGSLGQTTPGHAGGWVAGGMPGSPWTDAKAPAGTRTAAAVPAGSQGGTLGADRGSADRGSADRSGAAGDDWARQFALLLTEALAGARPLRQILPWTTDRARVHLDKLMPLFSGGQRPRVQRVITSRPTSDAIEMTVVVGVGTRTRALAVRLERVFHPQGGVTRGGGTRSRLPGPAMPRAQGERTPPQWLCTAIEAA